MSDDVAKREAQLERLRKARASRTAAPAAKPTEPAKRIKFTSKVKRGMVSIRSLLIDSFDDTKPPTTAIVAQWTKAQQREFNAAMEWLEQVETDVTGVSP